MTGYRSGTNELMEHRQRHRDTNATDDVGGAADVGPGSMKLLGGFGLWDEQGTPVHVSSEDARLMLACLAVHRNKPLTRVQLSGLLWPDEPEAKGRKWLSQAIWRLNQDIGGRVVSPIVATSSHVEFLPDAVTRLDVAEIDAVRSVVEAHWRDGSATVEEVIDLLDLDGGPFLDGHHGEWVSAWRERYEQHRVDALTWLVLHHRRRGDLNSALMWARRRVEIDPFAEPHHREVVRLLVVLDRAAEARAQIATYEELIGAPASPELTALMAGATSPEEGPSSTVVGRQSERLALVTELERVADGGGGVVTLEGEPGAGKTLLLEDLASQARRRQVHVVWVEHSRRSRGRPYAALAGALSGSLEGVRGEHVVEMVEPLWLELAAHLVPSLRATGFVPTPDHGLDSGDEQWRRREALCQIILALGGLNPTVLIVDDLHWADSATISVLRQLAPRLERSGVLVCAGFRGLDARQDDDVTSLLDEVEARPSIELEGMTASEVGELVAATGAWQPGDDAGVEQLLVETGGNPFFVVETLRARAKIDPTGRVPASAFPISSSVSALLAATYDELGDHARQNVAALSIVGRPCSVPDLCALTDLEVEEVHMGLDEAVDARLIRADDGRFLSRHHQIERVVRELLSEEDRRRLHDRAVDLLGRWSEPRWNEVAAHAETSGRWIDALDALERAAEEAIAMGATKLAIDSLERADLVIDELLEVDRDRRLELLLRLEGQFDVSGDRERQHETLDQAARVAVDRNARRRVVLRRVSAFAAEARFDEALRLLDSHEGLSGDAEGMALRGQILGWRGLAADAIPLLEAALAGLDPSTDASRSATSSLGSALTEVQEFDAAIAVLRNGLAAAIDAEDVRTQIEANSAMARLFSQLGKAEEAERCFRVAIKESRRIGYARGEGLNLVNSATLYAMTNRGGRALEQFSQAERAFEVVGNERGLAFVRVNRADLRSWLLGDTVTAAAEARAAAAFFRSLGDTRHESSALDVLANVSLQVGRVTACRRHADRALRHAVTSGDRFLEVQTARTLGRVELHKKRFAALLSVVQPALSLCKELEVTAQIPALAALEAQALLGLGRIDEAEEVARRTVDQVDAETDQAHLALWWCASVLAEAGNRGAAVHATERAWALLERNLEGLAGDERARAIVEVPEHRALETAIRRLRGRTVEVQLPDTCAPFGRPLRPEEYVTVRWNVEVPGDFEIVDKAERRQAQLIRLLSESDSQGASPTIEHLADALGVSAVTIKRDLSSLRSQGYQLMTRGTLA